MAYISAFTSLLLKAKYAYRPLLSTKYPYAKLLKRTQPMSSFKPLSDFFEKPKSLLFHPDSIMKHREVIPIICIVLMGLTCELLYFIRLALTRDDVWYTKGIAPCEYVETRSGPYYKVPIRKMFVINQKYEYHPDLLKAVKGEAAEDENNEKE